MRVLSWNLFHGRSVPDTPRALLPEFSALLAAWEWDVALLQEVPPWWPDPLGAACGARAFRALTSRNQLLGLTRPAAQLRPDLVKSWGGGANAILVRSPARVSEHRLRRLTLTPERRVMHAVRLDAGPWIGNVHASAHVEARAAADLALAAATLLRWAGAEPAILGGDTNMREPLVPGFEDCGGHVLDHVFARGFAVSEAARTLPRHDAALGANLSDHRPILVGVT